MERSMKSDYLLDLLEDVLIYLEGRYDAEATLLQGRLEDALEDIQDGD